MKNLSLVDQFPNLDFARKAQGWLDSIEKRGLEIPKQLRERKILGVRFRTLFILGCIGETRGGFLISLSNACNEQEAIETLGHEIGHTFHCRVRHLSVVNLLPDREMMDFDIVEEFCNAFSEKWLHINGSKAVIEFLTKNGLNVA